jgi:prephenate dehydrogenase
LARDLFEDGYLVEITTSKKEGTELQHVKLKKGTELIKEFDLEPEAQKDEIIYSLIEPYLEEVLYKYENYEISDNSKEGTVIEMEMEIEAKEKAKQE